MKQPPTMKPFQMAWMLPEFCLQLLGILQYFLVLRRQTIQSIFMDFQVLTNNGRCRQPCDHVKQNDQTISSLQHQYI